MRLRRVFPLIAFTINYQCRYLLACPHLWDTKSSKLVRRERVYQRWKRCSCFICLYFCFLLRGFNKYFDGSSKLGSDFAYHALYLIAFFLSLSDKFNCFRARHTYASTYNGFLKYFVDFVDTYVDPDNKSPPNKREILFEILLKTLISNVIAVPILGMVHYCREPMSRVYFTSELVLKFFEDMGGVVLKVLYFLVLGVFHFLMVANIIAELTIQSVCTAIPVFFYASIFTDFRSKHRPNFVLEKEAGQERAAPNEAPEKEADKNRQGHIIQFFRAAQIIQVRFCRLFEGRLLLANFVMAYFVVIGLLCLIRFNNAFSWEIRAIILIAVFSGYFGWAVCLWLLGLYYSTSRKFLLSWKNFDFGNKQDNKLMKKFLRSCQPTEMVTQPRLLRFRLMHVFRFMHFVNWGLCKILVATGKIDYSSIA